MAEWTVQQTLDGAATTSRKRNSYSREEKLRSVVSVAVFVLQSYVLADIRAPNVFVDMMPTNHALVRVFFQVFLAFCHSMPL